ncbi:hypothetical protein HSX10_06680 [Winogradskyella undariae]|uniref:carboxypeptidase-like regulatory domain-containing protein n=1 Tax=Winogradskyella TaxID=286104 RepID=UPI00156B214F|nr:MULTISPECIES: carboxypeptidase-like regulatory domain-containing protein [Winogradskyella]NRR91246.1 hypothetical protein [Winogradskyella undariae]QXP80427.1 hypothetical protein H0I32_07350 [Winogradskyella sp. HaHa_3_26]
MKQLLLLILYGFTITLVSCDVQLEPNVRILAKGTVTDQDNLPISNAKISVQTRRSNYSFGEEQYVIGEGYSDNDGSFSILSFYDKDMDFAIEIDAGENYSTYVYKTNTLDFTPLDLTFNLESIALKRLANFNFNMVRTSGDSNSINYSIKYIEDFCLEYYEGMQLNASQSMCYQEYILNRSANDDNPNYDTTLRVPFGETVQFTYTINDEPEITEMITINQENYDFTFSY